MSIDEAVNAVVGWLSTQPLAFLSTASALEIAPGHYRIGIQQVQPEQRRRVFEVFPLAQPDCYEVKEVG